MSASLFCTTELNGNRRSRAKRDGKIGHTLLFTVPIDSVLICQLVDLVSAMHAKHLSGGRLLLADAIVEVVFFCCLKMANQPFEVWDTDTD